MQRRCCATDQLLRRTRFHLTQGRQPLFFMLDTTYRSAATPVSKGVVAFVVLYLLAWVCLPPWLGQSFGLDVVESLSWGQERQWGYYKHPPLAPVVLNLFYEAFGPWGPYILSQLCIGITLWMVWRLGCRLMERDRALIGTVLMMGVAYYSFPTIEFNHNIAQMPLWAALGYAFLAAVQEDKLWRWMVVGLLAGLSLLTKYPMAVLLLTFLAYLLISPVHRRLLLRPGPWVALALLLVVFAPHALWLQTSGGLPFTYASARAEAHGVDPRLQALAFPLTQLLAHVPLLCVAGWALWRTRRVAEPVPPLQAGWALHTSEPLFLVLVALLPAVIVTSLGVVLGVRLRDMWGSAMWPFSGLLLAAWLPAARVPRMQAQVLRGMAVWLTLATLFLAIYMGWGAQLRNRAARVDWPAAALTQQADQTWQALTSCRLDTVAGDYWLAGLVSAYSKARPSVLIDGDPRFSPWVDAARLQAHGALWLWESSGHQSAPPEPLASVQSSDGLQVHEGVWHIAWPYAPQEPPLTVHWRAYVPAHCSSTR